MDLRINIKIYQERSYIYPQPKPNTEEIKKNLTDFRITSSVL